LGVNSAFDSIEELRETKAVPFELIVPEPIILASEDRIKDTSDDNSPVASSETAIGVNRVPFPVTVPASNNKLLPGAIIDPLEVNDPEPLKTLSLVIISELSDVIFPLEFILAALDLINEVLLDNAPEASIVEAIGTSNVPFAVTVPALGNKPAPGIMIDPLEVNSPLHSIDDFIER